MSEGYSVPKPIMEWNPARGVWEKLQATNLLCEHSEPFLEAWPASGTMRNGRVFERQTPEHHINDLGFSSSRIDEKNLLRTVSAIEGEDGAIAEKQARERNRMLQVKDQVAELAALNGLKVSQAISDSLLPTPTAMDSNTVAKSELDNNDPKHRLKVAVQVLARDSLLPTPNTMDHLPARDESKIDRSKGGYSNVRETVMRTNFGRFSSAIERWEKIIGRKAPDPTKPDGKENTHRLSSEFTEWMMGLPDGWVTNVGLNRSQEMRLIGNGVMPQQAEYALKSLLERIEGS